MKLLALDVGDRRVGVAVSDESGLLATPLTVVNRASKAQDFERIARLAREQKAEGLVVGYPLNDDGTAGPQARRIERYAAALDQALRLAGLDLPLTLWDEWGSTQAAQSAMIGAGRKARARRTRIDAVAAAVILQNYLDAHRSDLTGPGNRLVEPAVCCEQILGPSPGSPGPVRSSPNSYEEEIC